MPSARLLEMLLPVTVVGTTLLTLTPSLPLPVMVAPATETVVLAVFVTPNERIPSPVLAVTETVPVTASEPSFTWIPCWYLVTDTVPATFSFAPVLPVGICMPEPLFEPARPVAAQPGTALDAAQVFVMTEAPLTVTVDAFCRRTP